MNNYIANLGKLSIRIKQVGTRWYAFKLNGGTCLHQASRHDELWNLINGEQS
jgi:hypothetical protein